MVSLLWSQNCIVHNNLPSIPNFVITSYLLFHWWGSKTKLKPYHIRFQTLPDLVLHYSNICLSLIPKCYLKLNYFFHYPLTYLFKHFCGFCLAISYELQEYNAQIVLLSRVWCQILEFYVDLCHVKKEHYSHLDQKL